MLVLRSRTQFFRHLAAIGALAVTVAGCSSDFTRFNSDLYASTAQQPVSSSNPYPGDLDTTTTSSVGTNGGLSAPHPVSNVGGAPDHAGYRPGATTSQSTAMQWSNGNTAPGNPGTYDPNYRPQQQTVARGDLPAAGTDSFTTASVAPAQQAPQQQATANPGNGVRGWSATGGTTVTLRSGETLYNLSKRYGVPVSALMKANGISDPGRVQAGQQIVVPTYVYGRDVPVSAPDNNPQTRLASASRGELYAPDIAAIPVPERRPRHVASRRDRALQQPAPTNMASRMNTGGPAVDRVVTSSTQAPKPYVKPQTEARKTERDDRVAATSQPAPARTGIDQFRWPVRGKVISGFGEKVASGRNDGIDISVPEGTAVKAVENGVVVYSGSELEGFGNLILIRHADGWVSAYAHNKTLQASRGDEVRRGQIIARSGRTGNTELPKLHFELRRNSVPLDPIKYLGGA